MTAHQALALFLCFLPFLVSGVGLTWVAVKR